MMRSSKKHVVCFLLFCIASAMGTGSLHLLSAQDAGAGEVAETVSNETDAIVFLPFLKLKGPSHIPILFSRLLEQQYAERGNFNVIPQSNINELLFNANSHLAVERCTEFSCGLEIARVLKASYAVMGTVSTESNVIDIRGWLFDVTSGEILLTLKKNVYDTQDLDISAGIMAREIGRFLYPEYSGTFGAPNPEENILPDTPVLERDIRKQEKKINDSDNRVMVGDSTMLITAGKTRPFSWNNAAVVSGLFITGTAGVAQYGSEIQHYRAAKELEYASLNDFPAVKIDILDKSSAAEKNSDLLRTSAIVGQSAGTISAAAGLWIGDEPLLYMSLPGYIMFTAGYLMQVGAGFCDIYALDKLGRSQAAYLAYLTADTDLDRLWNDTVSYDDSYRSMSAFSYGLYGGGVLCTLGGTLFQGNKAFISGFWDRALVTSAMAFLTAGNMTMLYTVDRQNDMHFAEYRYSFQPEGSDAYIRFYNEYDDAKKAYETGFAITSGLWGASAACFLTAALFDFPDPFSKAGSTEGTDTMSGALSFSIVPGNKAPVFLWRISL